MCIKAIDKIHLLHHFEDYDGIFKNWDLTVIPINTQYSISGYFNLIMSNAMPAMAY